MNCKEVLQTEVDTFTEAIKSMKINPSPGEEGKKGAERFIKVAEEHITKLKEIIGGF